MKSGALFSDVMKYIFNILKFTLFSFNATAVLKTVENLGVSYVKLSEDYKRKLENESKNLNFPYRPEAVSTLSMTYIKTLQCSFYTLSRVTV